MPNLSDIQTRDDHNNHYYYCCYLEGGLEIQIPQTFRIEVFRY